MSHPLLSVKKFFSLYRLDTDDLTRTRPIGSIHLDEVYFVTNLNKVSWYQDPSHFSKSPQISKKEDRSRVKFSL